MANTQLEEEATDNEELQRERERADRAEAELAELRAKQSAQPDDTDNDAAVDTRARDEQNGGEDEVRKDSMMTHLMDSLDSGKDIGHYGRLVFAMVARHFLPHDQVLGWLTKDADFDEEKAEAMLTQVEERGYNPPKRDRILDWQHEQEFPILPDAADPECGNLYRTLKFPDAVYQHIEDYRVQKAHGEE